jgi:hypothetical protein
MSRIRQHLTYANVMVTILAFVVLGGGTALAAYVVSSNSQIGPGTVSGHNPPSGKHSNIIGGSVSGRDLSGGIKSSLRLHCPSDLRPVPDNAPVLCAETSTRDPAPYEDALKRCAVVGLRLPTDGELALIFELGSTAPLAREWTASHYLDSGDSRFHATTLEMNDRREIILGQGRANVPPTFPSYRCVTTPANN